MKNILLAALMVTGLFSCQKFLDKTPPDKLTIEQAFSSENTLQLYINSFYSTMLPDGPAVYQGDVMADITVPNIVPEYLSGKTTSQNAGGWSWTQLRNINYFLEHVNNPEISEKARNHFAGIARFFRAYFYFIKVKQFGDVPWYGSTMGIDDSALYKPRDPRTLVMDSVLQDLDFACNNIYDTKDNSCTQVTKWTALALKSRICLFEGTFRKYQTQFNLTSTADQWLQASADAANELITGGQYSLHNTGNPDKDYRNLFISENPPSDEVLLAAVYNNSLKKWHDAGWWYNSATLGARLGLAKTFVNTYLNADGTAFTERSDYATIGFAEEMKDRDKRLTLTIRSAATLRSDGTTSIPDFTVTYSGYQIQKFSLDDKYFDTRSESYNSIPIMRYAEVLLNYAEAKAELGGLGQADWELTIGALRKRAGINASPMPASADPYMQSLFPGVADPVLLEVRRERGVELAAEGLRFDDLRRWKSGQLLERVYDGLYVPAKGQLIDLDENGKPDVCFVDKVPDDKVAGVVYFLLDNVSSKLSDGSSGNLLWQGNIQKKFADAQYLYPIPATEILLNPNLSQNPGWE